MKQNIDYLKVLGAKRHELNLKNGLRVVLYERPGTPIGLAAAFRSGGRYDPIGQEGLAHMVEHMSVAGTKKFPTKESLAQYIETHLGSFGAYTTSDCLCIDMHFADAEDIAKAAEGLDEMINKPALSAATLKTEKGSVLRELGNRLSNPSNILWYSYNKLYFGGPAGRPVLGYEETIKKTTISNIRQFFDSQLVLDNLTLIIAGGITPEAVANAFEGINFRKAKSKANHVVRAGMPEGKPIVINHFDINDQVDFSIGFRTCRLGHPDTYSLMAISNIIGHGRASTLTRKLRYEKGYIYTGWSDAIFYSNEGVWQYRTACAKKHLQETLDIICGEFKRVYEGRIMQDELDFAKKRAAKLLKMRLQTSEEWINFHLYHELFSTNQTISDYMNGIQNVSLKDISHTGKKYFLPGTARIALAGNIKKRDFKINF